MERGKDITRLLHLWQEGDKEAEVELVALVRDDLRKLVHRILAREANPNLTSGTTEMFHELYLRLAQENHRIEWQGRNQFFAFAARLLRQVLVDGYRAKAAQKRGAGIPDLVLRPELITHNERNVDLVELHEALEGLEKIDPVKARVVELRFFVGMTVEQTAEVLEISAPTVKRYWRAARIFLLAQLQGDEVRDGSE